jgi:sec-independent protein translocase protein TatA
MRLPLIADLGAPELLIILAIVVLVFGASKLPELARGSGRALRIFKAETKGLTDDDDDLKTTSQHELEARQSAERAALEARQAAEREAGRTQPVERRDDTTA